MLNAVILERSLMYEHRSAFHRLKINDINGVRTLKFERALQSSMRLDDPYETDVEYVGYFHVALAIQPAIERVLVIGLGGGSLVKRLWRDYPEMSIDAVEIDSEVVEIAHEFFDLPHDERISVFVNDGRAFLATSGNHYQFIVVDAFDDDHVPPHLLTEEFLLECRAHLAEGGVLAYNFIGSIHGSQSKAFRSFYRTISTLWRNVWLFPVGLHANGPVQLAFGGNIMVFASDTNLATDQLLARIAGRAAGRVSVKGFGVLGKDLYQGEIRVGDVPVLLDPRNRRRR